jgi:hypothetical protein
MRFLNHEPQKTLTDSFLRLNRFSVWNVWTGYQFVSVLGTQALEATLMSTGNFLLCEIPVLWIDIFASNNTWLNILNEKQIKSIGCVTLNIVIVRRSLASWPAGSYYNSACSSYFKEVVFLNIASYIVDIQRWVFMNIESSKCTIKRY